MQLVNTVSTRLTICFALLFGASCEHQPTKNISNCDRDFSELSCGQTEFDCYRFDYDSIESFKRSVVRHADQWSLSSPLAALSRVKPEKKWIFPEVDSIGNANCFIEQYPGKIYTFGRYVEEKRKPREWLFVAEQAFLRSWNPLSLD